VNTVPHRHWKKTTSTGDAEARRVLRELLAAAIASADPAKVLAAHLPSRPRGRCVVVGAGKAAASMAAAVEAAWPDASLSGVVVAPYGYGTQATRITVREAGHPVPDEASVLAAREILDTVSGLGADDLVLALISGGGSASMCLPADGLSLEDKRTTNQLLLASGLDIRTMNAVRRRISAIKGGKLAQAAAPARVCTLAISDIPGDDATAIASGPTARDATWDADLSDVIAKLGAGLPERVATVLSRPGARVDISNAADIELISTPARALAAAADAAVAMGIRPIILGDAIEGESRIVAREMAVLIHPVASPVVLLSGGETTVTIGDGRFGRGGRNTEFLLSLASELEGRDDVWAIAADTDGEDGANLGAAGAICGPDTMLRARSLAIDPNIYLEAHDSGGFFERLGDLVVTGPTRTNVNDFRAVLVLPRD
jgi:glycerate 2-kinase